MSEGACTLSGLASDPAVLVPSSLFDDDLVSVPLGDLDFIPVGSMPYRNDSATSQGEVSRTSSITM